MKPFPSGIITPTNPLNQMHKLIIIKIVAAVLLLNACSSMSPEQVASIASDAQVAANTAQQIYAHQAVEYKAAHPPKVQK